MSFTKNSHSRSKVSKLRITVVALTAFAIVTLAAGSSLMASFSGAIFTSGSDCQKVNLNTFDTKEAVYLNGGPQNTNSQGLPPGTYCVQVTTPDGSVLGTSDADAVTVGLDGKFDTCYQLSDILHRESDHNVAGYDDTDNPGGVYKVLLSPTCDFDPNNSKSDNFKIRGVVPPPQGTLKVGKYYDANGNGQPDGGDTPILGWPILVGEQANFSLINQQFVTELNIPVDPGCYTAEESNATNWIHTGPVIQSVDVPSAGTGEIQFGNVCLGPGGGMTLGFWSNKNGQGLITGAQLCGLNALNLRNANGTEFNPVAGCPAPTSTQVNNGKTALKNWLLSANATNMANMLSAQFAAMYLNIANGKVLPGAIVYAPGTGISGNDFVTIQQLMDAANAELGLHENTTSGGLQDAFRAYQEALKNALDRANNNLNFVQTAAQCGVQQDGTLVGVTFTGFDSPVNAPSCP